MQGALDDRAEAVRGERQRGADKVAGGIVDQAVELSGSREEALDRGRVADVTRMSRARAAPDGEALLRSLEAITVTSRNDDMISLVSEAPRYRKADPGRAAGDQYPPALRHAAVLTSRAARTTAPVNSRVACARRKKP